MSEFQVGYDLNVWDEGKHNDPEGPSRWKISVHELEHIDGIGYQTGDWLEDVEFYFTDEEARQLTLGVAEEDGGLYAQDADFFIDPLGFIGVYEDVLNDRIREFVSQYL